MLRPGGYTFATDLDGKVHEGETFMCGHCNRHSHVLPGQKPADVGGYCPRCDSLLCAQCAATGICDPLEAKLERMVRGQ